MAEMQSEHESADGAVSAPLVSLQLSYATPQVRRVSARRIVVAYGRRDSGSILSGTRTIWRIMPTTYITMP